MTTVEQLRKSGNKVRCIHQRYYVTDELYPTVYLFSERELNDFLIANPVGVDILGPSMFGGLTSVEITTPEGKNYYGSARCNDKDNFNRRFGLNMALGRALKQLHNDKKNNE